MFETVRGWRERLAAAETETELLRAVLELAAEDLWLSAIAIYCFDEETAELRPAVDSTGAVESVAPGDDPVWRAFSDGRVVVCDGTETAEKSDRTEPYRIAVPFGGDCILTANEAEIPDDDGIVAAVRTLCATAGSAIKLIRYEKRLQKRDRELQRRTRSLERIERIAETYRSASRAAVSADTRRKLDSEVCDRLAENGVVEFVWIGDLDRVNGTISPRAWAGSERGYLEGDPIEIDDSESPIARAVHDAEVRVVDSVAARSADERWGSEALERGLRSVMAIPLSHGGVLHGVLAAYADRPNAFEEAIGPAADMGAIVGHAITALQCQDGLLADAPTELDIGVTAPACFFVRFVRETETAVSFEAMSPAADGSVLVDVEAEAPDLLFEYAEESTGVRSIERLEGGLFRGRFDESFIGSFLSKHGISLENTSATPDEVRITVSIPPGMTPRRALEIVNSEYPDSKLLAKRKGRQREDGPVASRFDLLDRLTDRQREALERAYREGYFEIPKGTTGESLATSMDISTSAFHNHLRSAEAELFAWLLDDESDR